MPMRTLTVSLLVGLCLLILSPIYFGQRIEREVAALSELLAARTDLVVNTLVYTPGYLRGELHLDLDLRPALVTENHAAADRTVPFAADTSSIRTTLIVRQGPWVGLDAGLALARMHYRVGLPQLLFSDPRASIIADARLTLGGEWRLHLRLADTRGNPDSPLTLHTKKAAMQLRGDRGLSQQALKFSAEALSFGIDAWPYRLAVSLDDLTFSGEQGRVAPGLWTGEASLSLGRFHGMSQGVELEWRDQSTTTNLRLHDGRLESVGRSSLSALQFGGTRLGQVTLETRLGNLDPEAWAAMNMVTSADSPDSALAAVERLLAGAPSLTQKLRVFSDGGQTDLEIDLDLFMGTPAHATIDGWLDTLQGEVRLRFTEALVRQAARMYVDYQARAARTWGDRGEQADVLGELWVRDIRARTALRSSGAEIGAAVRLEGGIATTEGLEPVALGTLVEPLLNRMRGRAYATVMPDHNGMPLYGTLELVSGAFPDPYRMEVVAGGTRDVSHALGEPCAGLIDFAAPDLILNFTAGDRPLFVYATSPADTTLTVRDPTGDWHCNDDAFGRGLNPGLEIRTPQSGDYAIWLGTWERWPADSLLMFSEAGMLEAVIDQ